MGIVMVEYVVLVVVVVLQLVSIRVMIIYGIILRSIDGRRGWRDDPVIKLFKQVIGFRH